ncbi:MAG: hypothetical protein Q9208_005230 [Pyrenodesmia sp. 3 TL-2023]
MAQYLLATLSKLWTWCNELDRKLDEIVNVDGKLDKLEDIISDIEGRLDGVESKIDDFEITMDNRIDETEKELDARCDGLDNRFKALEKEMDLHFEKIASAITQWILPSWLATAKILVKLLQYYKVQGFEEWGRQHDSAVERPGLAAAIHSHPDITHQALAMELGLPYDKIQANMTRDPLSDQAGAAAPTTGASSQQVRTIRDVEGIQQRLRTRRVFLRYQSPSSQSPVAPEDRARGSQQ